MKWSRNLSKEESYHRLTKRIHRLTKKKEDMRQEFIEEFSTTQTPDLKQVRVPQDFFNRTNITPFEFLITRFPGWDLIQTKEDGDELVFILERNVKYIPWKKKTGNIEVSKSIQENTPDIDWDSLSKEYPEVAKKISKKKVSIELNETELEKWVQEDPNAFSILERHIKAREPIVKITTKEIKDEQ